MTDAAVKNGETMKINGGTHTVAHSAQQSTGPILSSRASRQTRESESLIKIAADLEALQLKRLVLKSARDEMEVAGALAAEQEKVFQRRFDEITISTLYLANIAATNPARTISQLRAKAAFVLEFVEPGEDAVLDRLIWSLATELIVYAAAVMQNNHDDLESV